MNFDLRRIKDQTIRFTARERGKQVETVIKRYHRRYIKSYHDFIYVTFNILLNFLCSLEGKQQYINVSLIRYKYLFSSMPVQVSVRPFFTFNISVYVRVHFSSFSIVVFHHDLLNF